MSATNLSAINFVPPFFEEGKAAAFFVNTDPPNRQVTWTITPASGVTQRTVSNNGHRIDVVWGRSGEITITARCGSAKQSITVQVAPVPPPPPPPPPIGEPEPVPEITYISTKGNRGFLQNAREFHRQWGLTVKSVDSIEAIIDDLAGSRRKLARIRIVTHAFGIEFGAVSAGGLIITLFKGGPNPDLVTKQLLRAFAESDEAGLAELTKSHDARAMRVAKRAIKRGFREKLDKVRRRFTNSSWIDIRGCEVGGLTGFLRAVSEFFGSGTNKPHVSAPDMFQGFFIPAWEAVSNLRERAVQLVGEAQSEIVKALDRWTKIYRNFIPALPPTDRLVSYLDAPDVILPVVRSPNCFQIAERTLTLYAQVDAFARGPRGFTPEAKSRWLEAQWSPTLMTAATKLAKTWKGNNKAPRMVTLCGSLDRTGKVDPVFGETTILIVPDPDYEKHIKSI